MFSTIKRPEISWTQSVMQSVLNASVNIFGGRMKPEIYFACDAHKQIKAISLQLSTLIEVFKLEFSSHTT